MAMTAHNLQVGDIRAICFDCFDTLVSVAEGPHAYRRIVARATDRDTMREQVLTRPYTFEQHAQIAAWSQQEIERGLNALEEDLASIAVFDEAPRVLKQLRQAGFKIALCSNLATEFGPAALRALDFNFDTLAMSYELGMTKPDVRIFREVHRSLGVTPEQVLMVGDSRKADIQGSSLAGLQSLHINRIVSSRHPRTIGNLNELLTILKG